MRSIARLPGWLIALTMVIATGSVVGPPGDVASRVHELAIYFVEVRDANLAQAWRSLPEFWTVIVSIATVSAAVFAGFALRETRLDRQRRDQPRLRLMPGLTEFGEGRNQRKVVFTRGHIRNVGYGPALHIEVDFGEVSVKIGEERQSRVTVTPNKGGISELFENDRHGAQLFEGRFLRHVVRRIFRSTLPDYDLRGRAMEFSATWDVEIAGVVKLTFEDRGGQVLAEELPYRLVGKLAGRSAPARQPGRVRVHRGVFNGELDRGESDDEQEAMT